MKNFLIVAPFLLVAPIASAALTMTAVRTYDSATNLNSVDASATTLTAAQFTTRVAAAYDNGTGGVVTFDDYADSASVSRPGPWTVNYGASVLTVTGGGTLNMNAGNVTTIAATPLSGTDYYRLASPSTTLAFTGSYLAEFGFTILARNTARTVVSVTGLYSDGSAFTVPGSSNVAIGASGSGGLDTFFGFTAETGKAISSITINGGVDSNLIMDDFGFIVSPIPEPTVSLLTAAGLIGMARRRKRG